MLWYFCSWFFVLFCFAFDSCSFGYLFARYFEYFLILWFDYWLFVLVCWVCCLRLLVFLLGFCFSFRWFDCEMLCLWFVYALLVCVV